ncbi:MAG TPA: transporter substrate-binding domain-containing protein [Lactobacillaceae bacterium]|jgi:cystine transport system substrate-binding protein
MSTITKVAAGVVVLAVAGGITYHVTQGAKTDTLKQGTLTIGLEGTYAPFSYRDGDKLTGYDVDVATAVAKKLDLKPKFVQTKWDSLIAGLNSNRYDVVFNNVGITPERQKAYLFSTTYVYSKTVLIKKADDKNLTGIADIKGKKFAQTTTSNYGQIAQDNGAKIVAAPGFVEALNLITSNRADGTLNDLGAYNVWKKENHDTKTVAVDLSKEVPAEPAAPILNKKSTDLQKQINTAIKALKQDGTLKKLSEKYFDADLTEK